MEKLKLVSVRVDPRDLEELDKIVENSSYVKRSDLIQAGIKLYIAAHRMGKGRDVRRFNPRWNDVVDKFEFEFHREHR
jgi:metal-responsive CopG/Arc/MetJ family transcriptional regulator